MPNSALHLFQGGRILTATYRWVRRIVILIAGFSVLLVGVVMVVTPGPAIVVIPIGLGILGLEFAWARRWLAKVRERSRAAVDSLGRARHSRARPDGESPR